MRTTAAFVVCAVLLAPMTQANESGASLGSVVAEIKSVADGYPPKIKSPEHRADIEAKWRWVERGLLEYIATQGEPNAGVEYLLGEVYRLGYNLDIDGCGPKAIERLQRSIDLDPKNPNPYHSLGRHYTFSSEFEAGETHLRHGYSLAGPVEGVPFLYELAWNSYFQKEFEKAIEFAEEYLSHHPNEESMAQVRDLARQALAGDREVRTIEVPLEGVPDGKIRTPEK